MPDRPQLYVGARRTLDGEGSERMLLPTHHLVTHGVVVGMTGSGKTGLLTVILEEAPRSRVPSLIIDVKGDLPNLLLGFPSFSPEEFLPWVSSYAAATDQREPEEIAENLAQERKARLEAWGIGMTELEAYAAQAPRAAVVRDA